MGCEIDLEVIKTADSKITTKNGTKYLDFEGGWCVGNVGWNKKQLIDAMKNYVGPVYISPDYKSERREELAEKLTDLTSKNYTCFMATGGTEAVEIALKTAKAYNKKEKFLAFKNAYHGHSLNCFALTGRHADKFGAHDKSFTQVEFQNWDKTKADVISAISKGDVCAFVTEPILTHLGVLIPPRDFFTDIYKVCKENDTVFIADEVATGFGRCGKWFAYQNYDFQPDIIASSKGITSGHAVLGTTMVTHEVAESMKFDYSTYSTFGWHPISVEVALANIEYFKKNKIIENSKQTSIYLLQKLNEFTKAHGIGMSICLDGKYEKLAEKCRKDGLIISNAGKQPALYPALNITKEDIDKALQILKKHC